MKAVEHIVEALRRRQPRLQLQQALEQAFISDRLLHQQRHIFFQHMNMVTRPHHVPLHQRNRTAYRMRDAEMFDLGGITNKKFRMLQQIVHHCAIVQRAGNLLLFFPDWFHK